MGQRKNIEKFFCFWDDSYLMLCRKDGFFGMVPMIKNWQLYKLPKKVRVDP